MPSPSKALVRESRAPSPTMLPSIRFAAGTPVEPALLLALPERTSPNASNCSGRLASRSKTRAPVRPPAPVTTTFILSPEAMHTNRTAGDDRIARECERL